MIVPAMNTEELIKEVKDDYEIVLRKTMILMQKVRREVIAGMVTTVSTAIHMEPCITGIPSIQGFYVRLAGT